jgi:hypothetical protein
MQPLPRFPLVWSVKATERSTIGSHSMNMVHVGTPAHSSRAVREFPRHTYHDRWVGKAGPPAWPAHSTPRLNPLNLYPGRHIKTFCVDNEEKLHHRILDACQTICSYPGISERMWRSIMRRLEMSTEYHVDILSINYKYRFSWEFEFWGMGNW